MEEELDRFESVLEAGLLKMASGEGLATEMMGCPDIDGTWDRYIKEYVGDAVENFNDYPEAAIGFAAFLGMAVANRWDKDWAELKNTPYKAFYGKRGFDDMDDHIMQDVLQLPDEVSKKCSSFLDSCSLAALGLIRHEGIEAQTASGFYVMVRCCSVMFRLGATLELRLLGYHLEKR